jgi:glucose/arabinose dehydrogenase
MIVSSETNKTSRNSSIMKKYIVLIMMLIVFHSTWSSNNFPVNKLNLPKGLKAEVYARVKLARQLALGEDGVVYVGSSGDTVSALIPDENMRHAKEVKVIAKGLNVPNGVAFHHGALYIAEIQRIFRIKNIDIKNNKHTLEVVADDLPDKAWHGKRVIHFGPDGYLYVGVGVPCNTCLLQDKRFGTILRRKLNDKDWQVFAEGIRNTVGFDWHPETGHLWFSDNGQDWMGDELPPDEINRAPKLGMNFGFPYVYGNNIPTPQHYPIPKNLKMIEPEWLLPAHVAPLGVHFYRGDLLAKAFGQKLLICEHGSWNRSNKIGYRVSSLKVRDSKASDYQVVIDGWKNKNNTIWGRPVDVLEMPDGALLISDDYAGAVYRIYR